MEELTRKEFREKQQQQLVGQGAIAEALQYVKYKIAILSGKGGVGKSMERAPKDWRHQAIYLRH